MKGNPMTLPESYVRLYSRFIRFAVIMIFVGLLTGILFQESTRRISFSDAVPSGAVYINQDGSVRKAAPAETSPDAHHSGHAKAGKQKPKSAQLPPGMHWEGIYHLAMVHGHSFLIGVAIPMAVLLMLHLSLMLGGGVAPEGLLKWGTWLYLPGAASAILLMLYKGYHFVMGLRGGQFDFMLMNESLYGGSHLLRMAIYTVSHVAMAFGLGFLAVAVWKALGKSERARRQAG
jgi:hypothetical protein